MDRWTNIDGVTARSGVRLNLNFDRRLLAVMNSNHRGADDVTPGLFNRFDQVPEFFGIQDPAGRGFIRVRFIDVQTQNRKLLNGGLNQLGFDRDDSGLASGIFDFWGD